MRCGLEGARLFFRSRAHLGVGKGSRGVYMYSAGRALEDWDSSPPFMIDIFRCMGKASWSALSAIARHLRLRSKLGDRGHVREKEIVIYGVTESRDMHMIARCQSQCANSSLNIDI
ncbi:hypothetical protein SESBI_27246 [Sesbania bispinosa]|nr:hypothetical protein SESBI_27246 [Sesbania bispinosa]